MTESRPVPWDAEFWLNTAAGVLSIQHCRDCRRLQHYPRPACSTCLSTDLKFVPVSGRGSVYSFTVVRQPADPAFAGEVPYALVDVLLEEGPRLLSRIDGGADGLQIGDAVTVTFVRRDGRALPYFSRTELTPRRP